MTKLSELLAAAKAKKLAASQQFNLPTIVAPETPAAKGIHGETIAYNAEQQAFIDATFAGESAILIGAAGTGKTTSMRGMLQSILSSSRYIPRLSDNHKYLPQNTPGIVACSFTRRAVANLRKAMPPEMVDNCITIHKLLEYQPIYYEIEDEKTGEVKKTMRFEPTRHSRRPLDSAIQIVIIDESSMVSVELFNLLTNALQHPVQFIFLGDIQQLPPVFGSAILGYKMIELEKTTTELVQVYRQALESPIIRLAHRILSGNPINQSEFSEWHFPNQLTLHPWKKKISSDSALLTTAAFFKKAYDTGNYSPEEDMILIPFNKAFGTDELNKHIANHIARVKGHVTHEIVAGYNKLYLSLEDKVLYDKEDAKIVAIERNPVYAGKWPQVAASDLDYWGHRQDSIAALNEKVTQTEEEIDAMMNAMAVANIGDGEKVNQASHKVTVEMADSGTQIVLETAAELNSLLLGYALTVHKSQGSEWRKVFFLLHQSHATMIQRELLYTAVTRAREELYVICEPDSFVKGILNQRIKGNTLIEKAEYFKGKLEQNGGIAQ